MTEPLAFDKISLLRIAFQGLADEELREMAELTHLSEYPTDHILCHEGAHEEIFYIIASGSAIITKHISEKEPQRVLRIAGTGDLIGEMALIQNSPRSATVRATTPITTLEMSKHDFEKMLSRSPSMSINIIRTTLNRMKENDQMAIRELQAANKVLQQLDRNKLEFIQVAAHELRTPLTVIKGYVSLLGSNPQIKENTALTEVIAGIIKGSNRMHEIVNMMLDVTRIDNESLKIIPAIVLMKQAIGDMVKELSPVAAERNIEFAIELAEDAPALSADPSLVSKALHHLIVNAIKYTPDGGKVSISTRAVIMDNDKPGIEIRVKDSGIGLDPVHHELIFEKFYQVGDVAIHSSSRTAFKGGGPGLGLAIVRGVARAHGGRVWVESAGYSEVNFPGCSFYLQLPADMGSI